MYERILLPTDGSEAGGKATEQAVGLASLCDATLYVVFVVDTRDYSTLPDSKWLTIEEDLEAAGKRAIEAVEARARAAGVAVESDIARGVPHREILAAIDDHDADLVVMGTHGRTGLDRFLLGSVTEKVTRTTRVPVLVVRMNGGDSADDASVVGDVVGDDSAGDDATDDDSLRDE